MITLDHITKQYKLRGQKNFSRFLVVQAVKSLFGNNSSQNDSAKKTFLAVNDVSLVIQPGERVGLIGKNKAGKTTLLQMITGITEPTSGKIQVEGRVMPVFAQGTVLTPDQTGREYIYLHAATLGFNKKQVDAVINDIIEFSEIEHIDGMVKFYSTGTRTRLSLSIILHLPADIYIFDEVFYGSDIFFKEKVITRIKELLSLPGKTMVLVSHNEDIVRTFCERLVLLEYGRVVNDGPTDEILAHYKLK